MDAAFLSALALFTLTVLSPGPSVLAILSTGVSAGRLKALVLTAGILCGSMTWGLLALFGFVAILKSLGGLFIFLKIAGGLYLLYLAWKSAKAAMSVSVAAAPLVKGSLRKVFITGLLIHLTNPKAVFGWSATIAIGVSAEAPFSQAVALFLLCACIVIAANTLMAVLFSTPHAMRIYLLIRRKFHGVLAAIFGISGLRLITSSA